MILLAIASSPRKRWSATDSKDHVRVLRIAWVDAKSALVIIAFIAPAEPRKILH
jgi:hypothetical protein